MSKTDDTGSVVASGLASTDLVPYEKHEKGQKIVKKILQEDEFTEVLDSIIERDYFPTLAQLRKCGKGDKRGHGMDSGKISPNSSFETPLATSHKTRGQEEGSTERSGDDLTHMKLDKFFRKYTSEDNASFEVIIEEEKKKHRVNYPWLYVDEKKERDHISEQLALPECPEHNTGNVSHELIMWPFKNMNSVMYFPEGVPLTEKELANNPSGEKIIHENTRFTRKPFNERVNASSIAEAAQQQAREQQGKVGIDGKELTSSDVFVNGYNMVSMSPSPAPGVSQTPLMTWGQIEDTPSRLDGTPGTFDYCLGTPQFKIPDRSVREKVAHSLTEKLTKRRISKKSESIKQVQASFSSPICGSKTPFERLRSMSPAAQRLATLKLGIHKSIDRKLRESYTPSPSHRNRSLTPRTPDPRTFDNGPKVPMKLENSSPTYNLLDLPKRPKARDFF